jgi:organic hydroperoxide reductase OsmC/OhrA
VSAARAGEAATTHRARVVWRGDRADIRAHSIELAGQVIEGSSQSELGGDPCKADPEELFVASLSACHMLWFLDHARRERIRVADYEDQAEGSMDGARFTRVVLRPRVSTERPVDDGLLEALHARAHEDCFIANSVSCAVEVESR